MRVLLRVLAVLSLLGVLVAGVVVGQWVLPVTPLHVQQGDVPDGLALRVNVGSGVGLHVTTTTMAGGQPRYEYRRTSIAEPAANALVGRELTATCEQPGWADWISPRCHGDLLVVVAPGRPVRLYYPEGQPSPVVDPGVYVEEWHTISG